MNRKKEVIDVSLCSPARSLFLLRSFGFMILFTFSRKINMISYVVFDDAFYTQFHLAP
jgi:hypothetical protein